MSEERTRPEAGPIAFFTSDHRHCDQLWAAVELAVDKRDRGKAAVAWQEFDKSMRRHFEMEETVLFPALEAATGMRGGPTMVMRMEHQQVRGLLDQMTSAAARNEWETVVDQGDTLLMLLQQHNVKEEGILYPMAEQHLAAGWADVAAQLARF